MAYRKKSNNVAFYNQWWFWLIALLMVLSVSLAIIIPNANKNGDNNSIKTTDEYGHDNSDGHTHVASTDEHGHDNSDGHTHANEFEGPTSPGIKGSPASTIVAGIQQVFTYKAPAPVKFNTGVDEGLKWESEKFTMPNGGKFYYYVQSNAAHEFYYAEFTVEGKDDQQLLWWVTQFHSKEDNYKTVGEFVKEKHGTNAKKTFGDATYELINEGDKNTLKYYVKDYDGKYLNK